MANLSAPAADDLGPGAVLASVGTPYIVLAPPPLVAPPETISPLYGENIPTTFSFG